MSSLKDRGQDGTSTDGVSGDDFPEHEAPGGTQEAGSKYEGAGNNPTFSLAGPGADNPASNAYIGDQYMAYHPQYGKQGENPTWSLAQPLPHIVRPGMQHGALPEDQKEDEESMKNGHGAAGHHAQDKPEDGFFNSWSRIRHYLREPLAEWLGTTVAMTIGLCATLSNFTSSGQAGSYTSQSIAWGFGFMAAIYITGGISGGHLNPAFSIAMSVFRGFPARKCIQYIAAQLLGAITAGGIAYAIYHDAILEVVATSNLPQNASVAATAMITAPKSFVHPATAFFTEFLGSAILFGAIVALGDDTNAPPRCGDFGPRLVALMAGWGGQLFREYHAWWVWGPWCADITGALFGAFIYDLAIFTGGESPINYPPRRRKRAWRVRKLNLRKKLGLGPRKKTKDLENSVSEVNS
ncbi:hypothetical protein N7481_010944 [Penicillium waksmanii]|uniref:uncharacterized protein n=1 Tax=Penicillium waksmanii TaxID=69791 RepID=UPI0025498FA7|nr:uncharacterized protein N7481_010944 [Penicillium waksmanii]KAJ5973734.1 hypothetical protein N7481_010944 [Penicillium waksmanii]